MWESNGIFLAKKPKKKHQKINANNLLSNEKITHHQPANGIFFALSSSLSHQRIVKMDYERLSNASSFSFATTTNLQEPKWMLKNAYASQFQKNLSFSSNENHYPNYSNNDGNAGGAQFHHQKVSTTNYTNSNHSGTNNALININSNISYFNTNYPRQRFTPYYNRRSYANASLQPTNNRSHQNYLNQQQSQQIDSEFENSLGAANACQSSLAASRDANNKHSSVLCNGIVTSSTKNSSMLSINGGNSSAQELSVNGPDSSTCVTLQISNLDSTFDEHALKQHLINKLKPITSVISIYFEAISVAKIKLPSAYHAKQVISNLHRKKIGHKRITVSYTRESSSMEPSTLRCQVVGILKVSQIDTNFNVFFFFFHFSHAIFFDFHKFIFF